MAVILKTKKISEIKDLNLLPIIPNGVFKKYKNKVKKCLDKTILYPEDIESLDFEYTGIWQDLDSDTIRKVYETIEELDRPAFMFLRNIPTDVLLDYSFQSDLLVNPNCEYYLNVYCKKGYEKEKIELRDLMIIKYKLPKDLKIEELVIYNEKEDKVWFDSYVFSENFPLISEVSWKCLDKESLELYKKINRKKK